MNSPSDPEYMDTLLHHIDSLTPQIGELSRSDIVSWCLINYMAGARDLFAQGGDTLNWEQLSDPVTGVDARREIAASLTVRINELMATTSTPGTMGLDPNGRAE